MTVTAVLIVFVEVFDRKHISISNSSSVDDSSSTSNSNHQTIAANHGIDENKGWSKDFDMEVVRLMLSTSTTITMPTILSHTSGHVDEITDIAAAAGTAEHEVLPAHALVCLLQLSRHLQRTLGRPTIFEDELAQTCAEADLVAKISVTLLHVQIHSSESLDSNDHDEERVLMVERWRSFLLLCMRGATKSFCCVCYSCPTAAEKNNDNPTKVDVLRYRACRDALLYIADNVAELLKTKKKEDYSAQKLTTIFNDLNALLPIDPVKIESVSAANQNITEIEIALEKLLML